MIEKIERKDIRDRSNKISRQEEFGVTGGVDPSEELPHGVSAKQRYRDLRRQGSHTSPSAGKGKLSTAGGMGSKPGKEKNYKSRGRSDGGRKEESKLVKKLGVIRGQVRRMKERGRTRRAVRVREGKVSWIGGSLSRLRIGEGIRVETIGGGTEETRARLWQEKRREGGPG